MNAVLSGIDNKNNVRLPYGELFAIFLDFEIKKNKMSFYEC